MQLTLALAALAATASASFAVRQEPKPAAVGAARVVNRCPYDVYLWSIHKQLGCGTSASTKLAKNGGEWSNPMNVTSDGGISIKLSKWDQCGGKDQTQLEYQIGTDVSAGNFLDMSFVDCLGGDCPGWHDGFYMASGRSNNEVSVSSVNNEHCPEFQVANAAEAAKVSYVMPNDRQTKWCEASANLDLYLCGSQKPGAEDSKPSSSAAPSSSKAAAPTSSQAKPTTLQVIPSKPASSAADEGIIKAAAVTSAPPAAAPTKAVKTVITYVTVSVDAPMHKRHAHGRHHRA